jgi:outer membrane receptor protein involved in Fe transport
VLPAGQKFFSDRTGDPENQWGFNGNYRMGEFGFLLGATYFSEVWADRVKTVELPDALVFNAGFTWDVEKWKLRLNGYNLTDELYFRARSSDTGAQLISVMPGRRWELAAKYEF